MAAIVSDTTQTLADGSTVQTIIYADGARSEQYTPGPGTPAANRQALQAKAVNALPSNVNFDAIANPTTAQVAAIVKVLNRQVAALTRLDQNQLNDTAGT